MSKLTPNQQRPGASWDTEPAWLVEIQDGSFRHAGSPAFFRAGESNAARSALLAGVKPRIYLRGLERGGGVGGVVEKVCLTTSASQAKRYPSCEAAEADRGVYLESVKGVLAAGDDELSLTEYGLGLGPVRLDFPEADDVFLAGDRCGERSHHEKVLDKIRQARVAAQSTPVATKGYMYRYTACYPKGVDGGRDKARCFLGMYRDDSGGTYIGLGQNVDESYLVADVDSDVAKTVMPVLLPCLTQQPKGGLGEGVLCLSDLSLAPGSRVSIVCEAVGQAGPGGKVGPGAGGCFFGVIEGSGWASEGVSGDGRVYRLAVTQSSDLGVRRCWDGDDGELSVEVPGRVMERIFERGAFDLGDAISALSVTVDEVAVGSRWYEYILDWHRNEKDESDKYQEGKPKSPVLRAKGARETVAVGM